MIIKYPFTGLVPPGYLKGEGFNPDLLEGNSKVFVTMVADLFKLGEKLSLNIGSVGDNQPKPSHPLFVCKKVGYPEMSVTPETKLHDAAGAVNHYDDVAFYDVKENQPVEHNLAEPIKPAEGKELTLAELAQLQTQAERQASPQTAAFNKKALLENFLEHLARKYTIQAGEKVALPMQGVMGTDLVPVAPFRDYVAIQSFRRDEVTFQFYMENYGHLYRPTGTREQLFFANLSRIQYGLYLEKKGLVRLAEPGEIERNDMDEVLRQSREKIKGDKKKK